MVDIVVTYLNERDKKWQEDFKYWKDLEIKEGKNTATNRQAFGAERTREWDAFKYWFRGVEKNCPWINKIFLVVQNKNHVPEWLNTDNSRLRVVYHEDYIPRELLPTFNAMTIGMYISNIEELNEHYIMSDDDYYFLNPIAEDRFFKYGKPVHPNNQLNYGLFGGGFLTGTDNVFYKILNNNMLFEEKITKKKIRYGFYHLPEARRKSVEQKIIKNNYDEIKERNNYSKFRNEHNLCPYMFNDFLKIYEKVTWGNPYKNCAYCNLGSNVDFNIYWNNDMVCFNDTERMDDYEKTKTAMIDFLERKLPNKSSFEKGE